MERDELIGLLEFQADELDRAIRQIVALVEAANTLVQRLAAVNLEKPEATAFGNAIDYGPEVAALQDILEDTVSMWDGEVE